MSVVDWTALAEPIQDQGQCSSCTSFGLVGVMEALYFQKYGKQVKLSERDLFFCSGGKCEEGNTMEAPLDHARDEGVATGECCPYGDVADGRDRDCGEGRCGEWWVEGVKIASWVKLNKQAEIDAAIREGPLFMSMAVPQSFMNYVGGVFHSLGVFDPIVGYHAIGCFGKDFDNRWIEVRNSWGPQGWGEESLSKHIPGERGWFRAQADDEALELEYYKVVINGPIPEPEPPTPSPCTVGNGVAKLANKIIDAADWLGRRLHIKALRRRGRFYYLNR